MIEHIKKNRNQESLLPEMGQLNQLQNAQQVQNVPQNVPLQAQKEDQSQEVQAEPQEVQAEPQEVQAVPQQVQAVPQQAAARINRGFQSAAMGNNIDILPGEAPEQPKHIGMNRSFAFKREDDSGRMAAVRDALSVYLDKEENGNQDATTINNLIKACDKYCSGRFRIFKWGRGRERLDEVKKLREQAIQKKHELGFDRGEMIYNKASITYMNDQKKNMGVGRTIIATIGAFVGATIGNIVKLAVFMPLWNRDMSWKPGHYFQDTVNFMNRTLGRITLVDKRDADGNLVHDENGNVVQVGKRVWDTSTSTSKKERSETLQAEEDMIEEDQENLELLEEGEGAFVHDQDQEVERTAKVLAQENCHLDMKFSDLQLDQRHGELKEEELTKKLEEVERLDLKTISFGSTEKMLEDYEKSMETLSNIRAVHNQLLRGIMRGYRLPDKRLMDLRAKFKAAFGMQLYLYTLNRLMNDGFLDDMNENQIRAKIKSELDSDPRLGGYSLVPGDAAGMLSEYRKKMEKDYKNRKKSITRVYGVVSGSAESEMPSDELKKKMDAYESNAVIQDFMHHSGLLAQKNGVLSSISTVLKEQGKMPVSTLPREHGTWMYGKPYQERIRLTELLLGPGEKEEEKQKEKIIENDTAEIENEEEKRKYADAQYKAILAKDRLIVYKEMIRDMRKLDYKDFDPTDLTGFYDDYDRKMLVLRLYTNAKSIAREVKTALREIRDAETAEKRKKDPTYQPDKKEPLTLPDDFKEFNYGSFDDFIKDMHVTQEYGNALQGKFDSIEQLPLTAELNCFSIEELFSYDGKMQSELDENIRMYRDEQGIDQDAEASTPEEVSAANLEEIKDKLKFINIPIETRPLSKKQRKSGQYQETLVRGTDLRQVLKEEEDRYYKSVFHDTKITEKAEEESQKAAEYLQRMKSSVTSREKTKERINALNIHLDDATAEEKQRMTKELEDAFSVLLDFDLKELNFNSFSDLMDGSYDRAAVLIEFCSEFNVHFRDYKRLMEDPDGGARLTEEELLEIMAKKAFLQQLRSIYVTVPEEMSNEACHAKYNATDMPSWSEAKFEDELDKVDEELRMEKDEKKILELKARQSYLQKGLGTMNDIAQIKICPGMDMNEAYKKYRYELMGSAKDQSESIKEKLRNR